MKAAVYNRFNGVIEIKQVDDPVVTDEDAIIEVKASGICRSDWHGWKGHDPDIRLPHVPGHEFSGIVKEVGHVISIGRSHHHSFLLWMFYMSSMPEGEPTYLRQPFSTGVYRLGLLCSICSN